MSNRTQKRHRRRTRAPVHTLKWDRCVSDVSARGQARSAPAVCTAALGERGSILRRHRRRRNPRAPGEKTIQSSAPWVIVATKEGHVGMVYAGDRFVRANWRGDRYWRQGVRFPSREMAGRFARYLKQAHARPLAGWSLRVWQIPAPHWWFK